VLNYFKEYGFKNVKLRIYIVKDQSITLNKLVELEQYYIDSLKPNLNVELIARPGGYSPKDWGARIYLYNSKYMALLYIFLTKESTYEGINIDHRTLTKCLVYGNIYLETFFFQEKLLKREIMENY